MSDTKPEAAWTCKARTSNCDPPQDCDWPNCGCDPHAEKVLEALEESGLCLKRHPVVEQRPLFDGLVAELERRRALHEGIQKERKKQGLQRSEDVHRGRREAFGEALMLVQMLRAGGSLANLGDAPSDSGILS